MQRRIRPASDIRIGPAADLDRDLAKQWRDRTIQERADLFFELMRIWKADAPGHARIPMDRLLGAVEVPLKAGDALLFVDGISHGASSRTNPGERRVVIYRYGVSWGSTRYGHQYSDALIDRLTPERRAILRPIEPRRPKG
jgi:hypothetical protein